MKIILALSLSTLLIACEKGPAEKTGEKIDEAIEETSEKTEEVCDELTDENC
jgi:hypothetical protein